MIIALVSTLCAAILAVIISIIASYRQIALMADIEKLLVAGITITRYLPAMDIQMSRELTDAMKTLRKLAYKYPHLNYEDTTDKIYKH